MKTENIIGEKIKYLRKKSNLTRKNISKFLNVDQSFMSEIESGEKNLSLDDLEKLSALFGVSLSEFYTNTNEIDSIFFDFKSIKITNEDLHTISDINKIVLNIDYMSKKLKNLTYKKL